MYNYSSLVKDLAPKQLTRAISLRLTQTQAQYSTTLIWTATKYFHHNWRFINPNDMIQDNLERISLLVTHRSRPSTLNFGVLSWWAFRKKKLQLVGMSILLILLSLGPGCYILTPLRDRRPRRSIPSQECPLGYVRVSSANAYAMLCDHSRSTPAMRTMPAQLRHMRPWNRESQLWYHSVMSCLLEAEPAYIWPLSRT
jgi:hypothetical protein